MGIGFRAAGVGSIGISLARRYDCGDARQACRDSAFADIRFDRAVLLIIITAALNIAVDDLCRGISARLGLKTIPDEC